MVSRRSVSPAAKFFPEREISNTGVELRLADKRAIVAPRRSPVRVKLATPLGSRSSEST